MKFECSKCNHPSTNPDHLKHAGTMNVLLGTRTVCNGTMMTVEPILTLEGDTETNRDFYDRRY